MPVGRRARAVAAGFLLVLGGATLSACTSARNTMATPVSACYRALPVAATAVHHRGRFAGVRLVDARALAARPGLAQVVAGHGTASLRSVCVVVFRGSYRPSAVDAVAGAPSTAARPYAAVLVALPGDRLLGTVLLTRPPWGGVSDLL